jgi:hypothetical protein
MLPVSDPLEDGNVITWHVRESEYPNRRHYINYTIGNECDFLSALNEAMIQWLIFLIDWKRVQAIITFTRDKEVRHVREREGHPCCLSFCKTHR